MVAPDAVQEFGYRRRVPRLGGADPVVVGAAQAAPRALEALRDVVDPRLRREAVLFGGQRDLLSVLVHAHDEPDVVSLHAMPAGETIGADLFERVAEVWVPPPPLPPRGAR